MIKSVWVIGNKIVINIEIDKKEVSVTLTLEELVRLYASKN